jgi:hypothetical protein
MFEYNNETLTLDELKEVAEIKGIDFNTFYNEGLEKGNIVKKTSDVATQGAPVTSASGMASSSEDTSLELTFDDTKDKHNWLTSSIKDVETGKIINQPDYSFFDKSDDDAISILKEKYPDFDFETTNMFGDIISFNAVKITAPDGEKEIDIEFNIGTEYTAPDTKTREALEKRRKTGYESLDNLQKSLVIKHDNLISRQKKAYNNLISFIDENSTAETDKKYLEQRKERRKETKEFIKNNAPTQQQLDDINELFFPKNEDGVEIDIFAPKTETVSVFQGGGFDVKFGTSVKEITKTIQPYKKELEQAYEALGGVQANPSKEEVYAKAKDILVSNAKRDAWIKNTDQKLENLDDDKFLSSDLKKQLQSRVELGLEEYQREYASKSIYQEFLSNELKTGELRKRLDVTLQRFESEDYDYTGGELDIDLVTLNNGRKVSKKVFDQYQKDYKEYNEMYNTYMALSNDIISNVDKGFIDALPDQLDLVKRNYNAVEEFFVDAGLGFVELTVDAGYGTSKLFGDPSVDEQGMQDFKNKIRNIRESYRKDVEFDDAFLSLENFGSFAAQELANQLSIFAALSTPLGWGIIGTSSFGSQYQQMVEEESKPGAVKTSKVKKYFTSLGSAGAEVVFGAAPTFFLLRNAKAALVNNSVKNDIFGKGVFNYVKNNITTKQNVFGVIAEGEGEALTTGFQNLLNDRPWSENQDHSRFSGYMFGTTMGSIPIARGIYLSQFSDAKQKETLRNLRQEQVDLARVTQQLLKGISTSKNVQDKKNEIIKENTNRINELQELINLEVEVLEKKAGTVTNRAKKEFIAAIVRQEDIRIEVKKILDDKITPENLKNKKLLLLKSEFDGIQEVVNEFKKSGTWNNAWTIYKGRIENKAEVDRIREQAEITLMEQDGILDPDLEQINNKSRIIYNTEQIKKDISKSKKGKKTKLRNTLIVHETKEQSIEYLNKNLEGEDLKNAIKVIENGGHGFMTTENGKPVSVINIENMAEADRLEIKTHELQHVVFANAIGFNPSSYKPLSDAILTWTKENNPDAYDRITKLADRKKDGSLNEAEVVALFFEEVGQDNIKLNNKKNTQFGGILAHLIHKGTEEVTDIDIDLSSEKDAIKFLIGIAKKIKNDQLTLSDISDIKKNKIIQEIRKKDPSPTIQFSKEASDTVQKIYEQQGEAGLFEILEQFKPITTRIARRFKEVPGYDEQLIIDEIETGKRGIFDLIKEYKPESGVPLAAYINKFLPARSIEAGNRILKTEFEADVTEARGVAAQETAEDAVTTTERKTKAKVLADELNIANKVASEVSKANLDKTKLINFKSVPNAVTNTVGELLGISPVKIKSKANLTAAEVANAQRWFNKNAQLVIDALPQGFDVEGQATGVPRTVLQALYTQKETRAKTKAGLKGQVKRTNIKNSEFLALVDIVDGKPTRNRNTSARVIALADLLGKVITNQELRKTDPSLARIRSGMSDIMFSKAFNVRPEFRIDLSDIKNERRTVNKLLKLHDLGKTFEVKSINDIKPFIDNIVLPLFKLGPKEMFVGPRGGTVFTSSSKNLGIKSSKDPVWVKFVEQVQEAVETAEFGKDIPGVNKSEMWELRNKYNTLFGTPAKAKKAIKDGRVKDFNDKVGKIHRELWKRISKLIKKDRNNAVGLATYLTFVANDTGHWHKLGAQLAGYSKKITGARYEFEHAMPATAAYNYLLDAAITDADNATNDFDASYNLIIDNYKLIALDKAMDDKLRNARTASGFSLQKVMPDNWSPILNNWWERYFNGIVAAQDGGINPASIVGLDGRTFDQIYNVNAEGNTMLSKPVVNKPTISKAILNTRPVIQYSKESRGMSTFDFDETLIIEGENFIVAKKGDDVQRISSGDWPLKGPKFAADGYDFDFTDFVNVRGGVDGPLLQKMKNQIKKYGNKNVFILTARPAEAATAIHEWLKTKNIDIPFENITGLGNSSGDAKAAWFLDKYAEGYNDMYFVDDALPNVKAVKHVFDQLDVKGKSVQAKIQFSKDLSSDFNKILERTKGIGAEKIFSRIGAQKRGKNIGKFAFFVPPSADDFAGLLRYFAGKGKQGDADIAFFKKALIDPFARADEEMKRMRQTITDDYKALRKKLPQVKKKLGKMISDSGFTFDNAIRVYLWDKAGFDIPGLSKRDIKLMVDTINKDADLKSFADTVGLISKQSEGYVQPGEYWNVESIASDLMNVVNKVGRKQFLAEWIENKNEIFSEDNLNKIEATYGSRFREALENILWRMENGTNRPKGMGRLERAWTNWVNNSVGAIMFFNMRSAVLQTISSVNFINFEDNNIFAAAKAFANQKQYWKDFTFLFNSNFLKQRRAGLQLNVNEAELASAVAGATNKAKAAIAYLLKIGFTPTQIADSFAIAAGGSTFYRNRINKYIKEGMNKADAEKQAMLDFTEIAEETQQSARPDRISQQQASGLGRLILAFANTPMQYNRLIKKAAGDLINRRGDWRSNVSRIIYYGAIQSFIFSALQQALFGLAFDDEEDDEQLSQKAGRTLNSMLDSLLRGSGLAGAVVSAIKNGILELREQNEKGFRADYGDVLVELLNVSPPIGSKARKIYKGGFQTYKFNKEVMGEMNTFDLDNPVWDITGNVVSAATNLPLDRGFRKIDNISAALNQDNETWQRIAVALGWDQWSLGIETKYEKRDKLKEEIREKKKEEKKKQQQRCTKIKSDGSRCKIMVNKPKTRCHYHD